MPLGGLLIDTLAYQFIIDWDASRRVVLLLRLYVP